MSRAGGRAGCPRGPARRSRRGDGRCDQFEWCLYKDGGFRGCIVDADWANGTAAGDLDGDYSNCKGQKVKDSVTSYQNHTRGWLVLFEHPKFKGFTYCVVSGGSGDVIPSFNEKASSFATMYRRDFNDQFGEGRCNFIDRD